MTRDYQAERIEILEHRIRKYQSHASKWQANPNLWDEQIENCKTELDRARAGIFFTPRWFSDQEAHDFALRLAREAA
jgi:hypothetical protein